MRVSVIIATYNYGKYIGHCIERLTNQTFKDIEIIIVDDGSSDNTAEVISSIKDNRICYFYQTNQGHPVAKNKGIEKAQGEYLCFVDSDDYLSHNSIEERVRYLDSNPDKDWVFTDTYFVDASRKVLCKGSEYFSVIPNAKFVDDLFLHLLTRGNFITIDTVMLRRECLEETNGFNKTLRFHQDYELWLRIAKRFQGGYIHKPLAFMRKHNESWGTSNFELACKYRLKLMDHLESLYPESIKEIGKNWKKRRADAMNHLGMFAFKRSEFDYALHRFYRSITCRPIQFFAYNLAIQSLYKHLIYKYLSNRNA